MSQDTTYRKSVRVAIGATIAFALSQIFAWPLAFVTPVFAFVLLKADQPLSTRRAAATVGLAMAALIVCLFVSTYLSPYPVLMAIGLCGLLYAFFIFAAVSGAHILAVVAALIGALVLPMIVQSYPEIAAIAVSGVFVSLVIAILSSWVAFYLVLPPPVDVEEVIAASDIAIDELNWMARTTTLVVAPLMLANLTFGWGAVLTLVYAALTSFGLGLAGGIKAAKKSISANLLIGAPLAIITYELLVMVPSLVLATVLVFTITFVVTQEVLSDSSSAGHWVSGLAGFFLILGGSLGPFAPDADIKAIDRIIQIVLASGYVVFAYAVIDFVRNLRAPWNLPMQTKE